MNSKPSTNSEFASAEAERLYYLHALGISSYYPRFVLPGARTSEACDWPVAEQASEVLQQKPSQSVPESTEDLTQDSELNTAQQRTGFSRTSRAALLDGTEAEHQAKPEQSARQADPVKAADTTDSGEALSFRICLVPAARQLAICIQQPVLSQRGLGRAEQILLQNILHWLDAPANTRIAPRYFDWPLPGMQQAGSGVAMKSLRSFLQQSCKELGFFTLLMMGGDNFDWPEENESWAQINTHSLAELLVMPELKRSVYQHLLPLREKFTGKS